MWNCRGKGIPSAIWRKIKDQIVWSPTTSDRLIGCVCVTQRSLLTCWTFALRTVLLGRCRQQVLNSNSNYMKWKNVECKVMHCHKRHQAFLSLTLNIQVPDCRQLTLWWLSVPLFHWLSMLSSCWLSDWLLIFDLLPTDRWCNLLCNKTFKQLSPDGFRALDTFPLFLCNKPSIVVSGLETQSHNPTKDVRHISWRFPVGEKGTVKRQQASPTEVFVWYCLTVVPSFHSFTQLYWHHDSRLLCLQLYTADWFY